ncbi:MAG: methyltransferase domain-containing protein [Fimbriimonadaceae bacterium]|nr:methyltransferase domain-containing protein [Fimbriimonadaceae bacterium]
MAEAQYDKAFFDEITEASLKAARLIVPHLMELVQPSSVVDLGCGRGSWLKAFQDAGVAKLRGYDGGEINQADFCVSPEFFTPYDLRQPLNSTEKVDLAISMETAEHLPPERAESFVADLVNLAPAVYFSAAVPRQGGVGHINERPQSFWASLFSAHGYRPIDEIRRRIWLNLDAGVVYAQNGILYISEEAIEQNQNLKALADQTRIEMLDVIHPKIFEMKNSYYLPEEAGIAQIIKSLPYAIKATLARRK